eukprot:TRINITY_DN3091_c0_g7_i1.p1 TRINITY_DN3091_c0_g7~~TRINITY_DN3091_c0_g7_i1.p1  ORF type:complete len:1719 (+),score=402.64 TRINITY_DN3091_c0_g7_i1:53-5158(+)
MNVDFNLLLHKPIDVKKCENVFKKLGKCHFKWDYGFLKTSLVSIKLKRRGKSIINDVQELCNKEFGFGSIEISEKKSLMQRNVNHNNIRLETFNDEPLFFHISSINNKENKSFNSSIFSPNQLGSYFHFFGRCQMNLLENNVICVMYDFVESINHLLHDFLDEYNGKLITPVALDYQVSYVWGFEPNLSKDEDLVTLLHQSSVFLYRKSHHITRPGLLYHDPEAAFEHPNISLTKDVPHVTTFSVNLFTKTKGKIRGSHVCEDLGRLLNVTLKEIFYRKHSETHLQWKFSCNVPFPELCFGEYEVSMFNEVYTICVGTEQSKSLDRVIKKPSNSRNFNVDCFPNDFVELCRGIENNEIFFAKCVSSPVSYAGYFTAVDQRYVEKRFGIDFSSILRKNFKMIDIPGIRFRAQRHSFKNTFVDDIVAVKLFEFEHWVSENDVNERTSKLSHPKNALTTSLIELFAHMNEYEELMPLIETVYNFSAAESQEVPCTLHNKDEFDKGFIRFKTVKNENYIDVPNTLELIESIKDNKADIFNIEKCGYLPQSPFPIGKYLGIIGSTDDIEAQTTAMLQAQNVMYDHTHSDLVMLDLPQTDEEIKKEVEDKVDLFYRRNLLISKGYPEKIIAEIGGKIDLGTLELTDDEWSDIEADFGDVWPELIEDEKTGKDVAILEPMFEMTEPEIQISNEIENLLQPELPDDPEKILELIREKKVSKASTIAEEFEKGLEVNDEAEVETESELDQSGDIEPETDSDSDEQGITIDVLKMKPKETYNYNNWDDSSKKEPIRKELPDSEDWDIDLSQPDTVQSDFGIIMSIDPETARDLDDAISLRTIHARNHKTKEEKKFFLVGIHIADVSQFVKPHTNLDSEAIERSNTIYIVQRAIPMLPRLLCEQLCSLNCHDLTEDGEIDALGDTTKLAFSITLLMNENGEVITRPWIGKTRIVSSSRLTYEQAQMMIKNETDQLIDINDVDPSVLKNGPLKVSSEYRSEDGTPLIIDKVKDVPLEFLINAVQNLWALAKIMRHNRFYENYSVSLPNKEIKFKTEETTVTLSNGKEEQRAVPVDIYKKGTFEANWLVEEFMLLANIWVGKTLILCVPDLALFRSHEVPKDNKYWSFFTTNLAKRFSKKHSILKDLINFNIADQEEVSKSMNRVHEYLAELKENEPEPNSEKIGGLTIDEFIQFLGNVLIICQSSAGYTNVSAGAQTWKTLCKLKHLAPEFAESNLNLVLDLFAKQSHYALNFNHYMHFTSPIRRYPDVMAHRLLYVLYLNQLKYLEHSPETYHSHSFFRLLALFSDNQLETTIRKRLVKPLKASSWKSDFLSMSMSNEWVLKAISQRQKFFIPTIKANFFLDHPQYHKYFSFLTKDSESKELGELLTLNLKKEVEHHSERNKRQKLLGRESTKLYYAFLFKDEDYIKERVIVQAIQKSRMKLYVFSNDTTIQYDYPTKIYNTEILSKQFNKIGAGLRKKYNLKNLVYNYRYMEKLEKDQNLCFKIYFFDIDILGREERTYIFIDEENKDYELPNVIKEGKIYSIEINLFSPLQVNVKSDFESIPARLICYIPWKSLQKKKEKFTNVMPVWNDFKSNVKQIYGKRANSVLSNNDIGTSEIEICVGKLHENLNHLYKNIRFDTFKENIKIAKQRAILLEDDDFTDHIKVLNYMIEMNYHNNFALPKRVIGDYNKHQVYLEFFTVEQMQEAEEFV